MLFELEAGPGIDVVNLGVRLKVLEGALPFDLPDAPVSIFASSVIHSWGENETKVRPGFRARMRAQLVSSDGSAGPWFTFDIDVPAAAPMIYVHPLLIKGIEHSS